MGRRASRNAWTYVVLTLTSACSNAAHDETGVNAEALKALQAIGDSEVTLIDEAVDSAAGAAQQRVVVQRPIGVDSPVVAAPPVILTADPPSGFADLIPDGSMRYIDSGYSSYDIQINVVNVGTAATIGSTTRASIGGSLYNVTLYHYWDGTTNHDNVLPGQRGYLLIKNYPMTTRLYPCQSASVQIDLDHALQYGDFQGNDTRDVLFYETGAICDLKWTTPINAATTGIEPSSVDLDDHGTGYSLQAIVSSFANGRRDGNRCSNCHNIESSYPYNPPVPVGGISEQPVDPSAPVSDGQSWVGGTDPWIYKFLARPDTGFDGKTPYLKAVFRRWYMTGAKL